MLAVRLFCVVYLIHNARAYSVHRPIVGITGGDTIPISNAPFMASLVRYLEKITDKIAKLQVCGGSIIHEKFILTAAHCLLENSFRDVIRVGSSHLYEGGITHEVEKFIPHENFSLFGYKNDIALVKLKENMKFTRTVSKISLAGENFRLVPYTAVNVTGWGQTSLFSRVSKELRQVLVETRPQDDYSVYPWITDDSICALSDQRGSCRGDSGGPLTLGDVQIAVVSNGMTCGFLPSVNTKVSKFLPWINKTIKNNL